MNWIGVQSKLISWIGYYYFEAAKPFVFTLFLNELNEIMALPKCEIDAIK